MNAVLQVYLNIDGQSLPCPVEAHIHRYTRSDQCGFAYHLADMQGIFARLRETDIFPSVQGDRALQLTVTSQGAVIERLDMLLRNPQAEVQLWHFDAAGCCQQRMLTMSCMQAPNFKFQAITAIITVNGGFLQESFPAVCQGLESSQAWLMFTSTTFAMRSVSQ